ncbi:MAG TPA: hypothetical protein VHC97_19350 [Thermoanaerobaculia bacterium]|jgi:hypothetical protein|nr:hypothetical protein [Thermoanaerobaculia bacterium]
MSEKRAPLNAFSPELLRLLREMDEPEASAEGQDSLVLRESEGRFALFRNWRSFEAGDVPEAAFETREDALIFLAARGALSRGRRYELGTSVGGRTAEGFTVEAESRPAGWLRTFDSDWVSSANALAGVMRSSEDLARLMVLSGPARMEEVGEIIAREILTGGAAPGPERA